MAAEHTPLRTRALPLWAAIALSLALVGPTLAMSGNGQYLAGSVGAGIPLVFLIGLVGVGLVGYGFIRLTRHLNHAGSAYGLVGGTVGPRAGFFAGFAMLGAYVGFAIGTIALTASFVNSFLAQLQPGSAAPFQIPWIATALVGLVISAVMAGRDVHSVAKVLIAIEAVGIAAMIVLAVVIFAEGGAPTTGIDFSAFTFAGGVDPSTVLAGVVAAFLSWAGFEACAALGEETADPRRNIPRALIGTLALTGVLFLVMMFAQTVGFGTDEAGLAAFAGSANSLGDLGHTYVGSWFSAIIVFTATVAAFGCHLATTATAGRMLFAFARNGFGPRGLRQTHGENGSPQVAMYVVIALCLVANLISFATGWPAGSTGEGGPNDTYLLFAVAGSACLMVAYFMVEIAAIVFVTAPRFQRVHGGTGRALGVGLPAIGAVVIAVVLWFNVKDSDGWDTAPLLGLYWCLIGLVVAVAASRVAARVGASLAEELELPADARATR
jgi:amino acid transporter